MTRKEWQDMFRLAFVATAFWFMGYFSAGNGVPLLANLVIGVGCGHLAANIGRDTP